ncbi:hypothetical protein INF30_11675 [Lachnospiraceae bacterium DSM 108991]|uniref:Nitric oxide reductase activation protein n=1 Tax=Claveliimonas monacensis TaxID=2779351 RepID=A0ABR9RLR2_9FIRM|nr:hypothetical protein [Claveliimonas monacensis]MBE5063912.1 hypothetical protein [Claveliimonas monacensis]
MEGKERFLLEAEKMLSDYEFFTSPRFMRLLHHVGKEITDRHNAKVRTYGAPDENRAGYFEGTYTYINVLNEITQSFPSLELRGESILGVLGHECGHQNYSSIYLRKKYVEGISNGILYPYFPKPRSEKERLYAEQMKELFVRKDRIAIELYLTMAAPLHGLLEDVYIEERMMKRFPGSIRRGIQGNRKRIMERYDSVKKLDKGGDKLGTMASVLTEYMFTKRVNAWDGEIQLYADFLRECIPLIHQAAHDVRESSRFIATNQILLAIWPLLLEKIEELQEMMEQTPPEKQEDLIKKTAEKIQTQMPQYSEEPICREHRMEEMNASDVKWTGADRKEETGEERPDGQNGDIKDFTEAGKIKEAHPEDKKPLEELSVDFPKEIDISRELRKIRHELAEEKTEKMMTDAMREALKNFLEGVKFHPVNEAIPKEVIRKDKPSKKAELMYEQIKPEIQRVLSEFLVLVQPILMTRKSRIRRKQFFGKSLDMKNLWDPQDRVFKTKISDKNNFNTAIAVLMDQSASIDERRRLASILATLCIVEFAQYLKIPVCVYGHCTDFRRPEHFGKETVCLHSYMEFEDRNHEKLRILDMKPGGANRDGVALQYMEEKLKRRKERQKLLFFTCDGLPNASDYGGEVARDDLKQIQKELHRDGIHLLVAAIGEDQEEIHKIYGNSCINTSDLSALPGEICKRLLQMIL